MSIAEEKLLKSNFKFYELKEIIFDKDNVSGYLSPIIMVDLKGNL
jgi:hypothetical protein